jgi:hypothetical protein
MTTNFQKALGYKKDMRKPDAVPQITLELPIVLKISI